MNVDCKKQKNEENGKREEFQKKIYIKKKRIREWEEYKEEESKKGK